MKSNELIKLSEVNTGAIFECRPLEEFVMPEGIYKSWNEARLFNDAGETEVILKAGQIVDNPKIPVKRKPRLTDVTDD